MRSGLGGILQAAVIVKSGKGLQPPDPPAVRCVPNYLYYPGILVPFPLFYTRGYPRGLTLPSQADGFGYILNRVGREGSPWLE